MADRFVIAIQRDLPASKQSPAEVSRIAFRVPTPKVLGHAALRIPIRTRSDAD
ncbi:MAG: hypothetical protein IPK82_13970 [Polyangiaceae bacterium]|nr:hypothetical protein [Polyangiaceae bacterium]